MRARQTIERSRQVYGYCSRGREIAYRRRKDSCVLRVVVSSEHNLADDAETGDPHGWMSQMVDEEYDWDLWTVPQKHANGNKINWNRYILSSTFPISSVLTRMEGGKGWVEAPLSTLWRGHAQHVKI